MGTGVPGVVGPLPAGEVPRPVPPGVVVVAAREVGRTARRLVRTLGGVQHASLSEASQELARQRDTALDGHLARLDQCRADAAAAEQALATGRAALRPGLAGARPDQVLDAADEVHAARQAVQVARTGLGPRPVLDGELARLAHEAHAALEEARRQRGARTPSAVSLLTMANCGAGTLVAGRVLSEAFDPAFFLVAVLPLGALGYAGSLVVQDVNRCRLAARRRWTALRALDLCTMAGLASAEAGVRAWENRSRAAAQAGARLAHAEAEWSALVGRGVSVEAAPQVVAALEQVEQLQERAVHAWAAMAEAAAALQCAEDLAGAGVPPLVVADRRPAPDPHGRALAELAEVAGLASVVLVRPVAAVAPPAPVDDAATVPPDGQDEQEGQHSQDGLAEPAVVALPEPAHEPDPAPAAPVPAAASSAVVDLRQRVLSGLLRLRSRPLPRDRRPPGEVASGG